MNKLGIAKLLFSQNVDTEEVFVAECCNRFVVSIKRPTICKTCSKEVAVETIKREDIEIKP